MTVCFMGGVNRSVCRKRQSDLPQVIDTLHHQSYNEFTPLISGNRMINFDDDRHWLTRCMSI